MKMPLLKTYCKIFGAELSERHDRLSSPAPVLGYAPFFLNVSSVVSCLLFKKTGSDLRLGLAIGFHLPVMGAPVVFT